MICSAPLSANSSSHSDTSHKSAEAKALSETDSTVLDVRLLIARCEVLYTGRLTARLPEAVRLLMFKADGSFLVHDDAGGYRPLNWIRSSFRPGWRWSDG